MGIFPLHNEDIKARIRKEFGSVKAFEAAHGLPRGSVTEVFRDRRWAKVEKVILKFLDSGAERTRLAATEMGNDSGFADPAAARRICLEHKARRDAKSAPDFANVIEHLSQEDRGHLSVARGKKLLLALANFEHALKCFIIGDHHDDC
jgi:lambda repressor-like predicted transcriptional regulator